MVKISLVEFQKNLSRYLETALAGPVTVTRNDQDYLVLLPVAEYQRLKRRERQVLSTEEFTDADIIAVREAKVPPQASQFDGEDK